MRAPIILVSQDRLDLLLGQVAGRSRTVWKVYRPHVWVRGKTLNQLAFSIRPDLVYIHYDYYLAAGPIAVALRACCAGYNRLPMSATTLDQKASPGRIFIIGAIAVSLMPTSMMPTQGIITENLEWVAIDVSSQRPVLL